MHEPREAAKGETMAERADGADPSTKGGRVAARLRPLRSVRVRITLAAVLVTAVAMVTTGWLLVRSVERSQLGAIGNDAEDVLDQVTGRLAAGVPAEDAVRPEELATAGFVEIKYEDGSWINFVPIFDVESGEVELGISRQDPDNPDPAPSEQPHIEEPEEPEDPDEVVAVPGGANGDGPPVVGFPVEQRAASVDTPSGEVNVTVAAPVDQVAGSLDAVRRALTIGFPLLVGLVALAAWWLVGRALRPVELIRAEADAIGASTLHRRVSESGTGDEVNRLSQTMNAMLERLEGAVTRQRQFVADASHELRNPVAGIRTNLEVALREGEQAAWTDVAREVLAEEARLESLIGDLLVLAAEDEGAATLPRTELDLTELAANESRRSRRVTVSSATDSDSVVVLGSHNQLQRAVANLVDNAARHADRQVHIGTTTRTGWAELWVDDDGPSIPPADRERVFERFTRLDDGRARDQGGSGLGLAVVRSIVTRHRGRVWAEDSPLGGARFTIALPTPSLSSSEPQTRRNATVLHQNRPTTTTP
jgi:signal transduction histidine kinase